MLPTFLFSCSAGQLEKDEIVLNIRKSERSDTGRYKLQLKNPSGTAEGSLNVTVLDKPGKPQGPLEATDFKGESLTLNWKPPLDDGGERITRYVVEKKKKGTDKWAKAGGFVSSPTCDVRNLEPGTEYEFRVMAENPNGISDPLMTTEPILAKYPFDKPGAPGVPKCKTTTEDSITLTWTPPKRDGGNPISGYVLEKREKGEDKWTKCSYSDIPDHEFTARGLTEGKEYEFCVAAVNQAGTGEFSNCTEPIKAQPPPSKIPLFCLSVPFLF